jgi:hypothetical protein
MRAKRRQAPEHPCLLAVGVNNCYRGFARQIDEPSKRAPIVARSHKVTDELHGFIANTSLLDSAANRAVRAARDECSEAVLPEPFHDLRYMLGNAPVTRFEGVEDH